MTRGGALLAALLAAFAAAAAEPEPEPVWMRPPAIEAHGDILDYVGFLNPAGAQRAADQIATGHFRTLRIDSAGGEIHSAIKLGTAVRAQRMDIVVQRMCASSCANYVFPAAARKVIEPGGVVAWHGDARQRNFLLRLELLQEWERSLGRNAVSDADREWMARTRRNIEAQDTYYAAIGVKDGIARVGQERQPPVRGFWTLPAADMQRFGIDRIEAPAGYGQPLYCDQAQANLQLRPLTCLALEPGELNERLPR